MPLLCLCPDPANGRVVGATSWPASDAEDGETLKLWAPADLGVHPDSPAEAVFRGDSLLRIKTLIEEAAENTRKLNPGMKDKIRRDGILDPLLCQISHVETLDGNSGIALITRDGSTRCSFAIEAHGGNAHDAFFGSARDADFRRQQWLEMRRQVSLAVTEIDERQLVELRTFMVDVQIVVGFHSDDPNATALDAVEAVVRRTHVEATHPWRPVAQRNSEADHVLASLRKDALITEERFMLYGGQLPRARRLAAGLPVEPDCVTAELMLAFGAGAPQRTDVERLHTSIRSVDGRGNVRAQYKAQTRRLARAS